MTGRLTCGCPGEPPGIPCLELATQEDLLCDVCRARGCPTVTPENSMIRDAQGAAAMTVPF